MVSTRRYFTSDAENNSGSQVITDTFTPEEKARFAIQYNEGYDILDARYLSWLQLNHPNESCQEIIDYFPDVNPLDAIANKVFPSITDTTTDIASSDPSDFVLLDTVNISQPSAVHVSSITDVTPGLLQLAPPTDLVVSHMML